MSCRQKKFEEKYSTFRLLVYPNTTTKKLATDVTKNTKFAHRYVYIYLLNFRIRLVLVI